MSTKNKPSNASPNSRIYVNKVFGFDLSITVPATVEEIARILGDMEEVWKTSVQTLLYRRWNPEFRERFCERLEEVTGVKRPQAKDGNGNLLFLPAAKDSEEREPKLVTEQVFLNQCISDGLIDSFAAEQLAREIAADIPVDFTPRTRELKPSPQNKKDAQMFYNLFDSGAKDPNDFRKSWEVKNNQPFPGDPMNIDDLAKAFRIWEETMKRTAASAF